MFGFEATSEKTVEGYGKEGSPAWVWNGPAVCSV
jgi:hypothetical protein